MLRRTLATLGETTGVRAGHAFNVESIRGSLVRAGLSAASSGEIKVSQFSHGQSNPTYVLKLPDDSKLVLRKKPAGKLLRGAHAVEREYQVMTALYKKVPVPRTRFLETDESLIGTPFFVYDFVEGEFYKDCKMQNAPSKDVRAALYSSMIDSVAALHSVDYNAVGLGSFGKVGDYVKRQTKTWATQFQAAEEALKSTGDPAMASLQKWLSDALPPADDLTTIVHGDARVDNMIFRLNDGGPPRVAAILDFELSTLGHPGTDVALLCMPYHTTEKVPILGGLAEMSSADLAAFGIPTEHQLVGRYLEKNPSATTVRDNLDYYHAFASFRMASILRGVSARSASGNASSAGAKEAGKLSSYMCDIGLEAAKRFETNPNRIKGVAGVGAAAAAAHKGGHKGHRHHQAPKRDVAVTRLQLDAFMKNKVMPMESEILKRANALKWGSWTACEMTDKLKKQAKAEGLWNLFLPAESGLTNAEYATLAEVMGNSLVASEVFNCQAPDTGNMEVLHMFGTESQQEKWFKPLLAGEIKSCFAMTEPQVASSDATNMQASITVDGDELVLHGKKIWISGSGHPDCKICIFMGRDAAAEKEGRGKHNSHSMVLVPMNSKGLTVERPMSVFGYEDGPHGHCEMMFDNVRVPKENVVSKLGDGFMIAQARLGPGRIHHCMRLIGMAERSLNLACKRADERIAFGKPLSAQGVVREQLARSRVEIDQARLLTIHAANMIDQVGAKNAKKEIGMIKVVAPQMACNVIDRCMQIHGGSGLSQDFPLAQMYSWARVLRLADGPDEVHYGTIAKLEMAEQRLKRAL